jgi:hypothetical protein
MKNLKSISLLMIGILGSCSDNNTLETKKVEQCPCDSTGIFFENGKHLVQCYFGKSLIDIAYYPNSDTMEVTRRYTTDKVWHFQEFMVIANNQLIVPDYALYCDIKDTAEFYKLTYISNEDLFIKQGVITNRIQGVEVILDKDTVRSNNLSVLAPKNKFKGIIEISKKKNITYKGKIQDRRTSLYLEAESMIKYGNLLEQYKAINRLCNRNSIRQEDLH